MSKAALLGGTPVRTGDWPRWPVFGKEEEANILQTLHSGNWWMGPMVEKFEAEYAAYQDAGYGISCANGTVAIEAALLGLRVGFGDEVITTPYTFVATTGMILKVNALPVYADIDELTGNLDPDRVEARITDRTAAIVPVHVGGRPVDIDRFQQISEQYGIPVLYDAAHGWGSQWRGKGVGAYGAYSTYSFQASKNMTAGEGGIILTCDEKLAADARSYVNCGRVADGKWYEHGVVGANLRATEFGCAVLRAQLQRLPEQTRRRAENAELLTRLLNSVEGIRVAAPDPRVTRRAYHLYQFCLEPDAWDGLTRGTILEALEAEGIPASGVWPLMYQMGFFDHDPAPKSCPALRLVSPPERPDYPNLHLPNAERLSHVTGMWLNQNVFLAEAEDMHRIAEAVARVRENRQALLEWQRTQTGE
jgi:dTDP-4-amino-4,6-dideoxygalactose transaminase